jgi:hypothetical protein
MTTLSKLRTVLGEFPSNFPALKIKNHKKCAKRNMKYVNFVIHGRHRISDLDCINDCKSYDNRYRCGDDDDDDKNVRTYHTVSPSRFICT